jgi:acyl carrier protein
MGSGAGGRKMCAQQMMQEVVQRITRIVCGLLQIPEQRKPDPNIDLWNVGLSSIAAIQLVIEVQREFGLELGDEDMNHRSLATINSIAKAVMLRTGQIGGSGH